MIVELISGAMIIAGAALLLIGVIGLAVTGDENEDDGGAGAAATGEEHKGGVTHEFDDDH